MADILGVVVVAQSLSLLLLLLLVWTPSVVVAIDASKSRMLVDKWQ
jgi:hypothetical protein